MDILIKNARIYSEPSISDKDRKDILISKGIITKIAKNIPSGKNKVIKSDDLRCSIGWFDIGTYLGEPGFEFRETTDSLCQAATIGGYTAIAPSPLTDPCIQSASDIKYLKNLFTNRIQDVYPIAALSLNTKGADLTEMKDLTVHGAVAFGDGLKGIQSAGLLLRALLYTSGGKTPIIDHPVNYSLADGGQMHEGDVSVMMGLKGVSSISESIQVNRNIALSKYANSRLILHCISQKKSVQYVKDGIKRGLDIAATVPYLNLIANHHNLEGFNVNYKVTPPLRTMNDQKELWAGINKKVIHAIVSNHVPLESEKKMLEYPYATPGATGLESCFAALSTHITDGDLTNVVQALAIGPRQILNIPIPSIKVGEKANLTVFDPTKEWQYDESKSLSKNNPLLGSNFTGKAIGVVNGTKHAFH